ncbi:MAG: Rrf2 family transcriptional regulator [Burkholderiales bacterium]|nr:Rrf2 family transcriptional regulator [Burkholderiales bacterium]
MRLTAFSDYALRVLIYLGAAQGRLATIAEIAAAYGISANHLRKVVHHLARQGYVETVRGKGGGLRLARPAQAINVGAVVRVTEDSFALVDCFERGAGPDCRIERACVLKDALARALEAFLATLDGYTLVDLLGPARPLARILMPPASPRRPAAAASS